jgi:hypothetical protein
MPRKQRDQMAPASKVVKKAAPPQRGQVRPPVVTRRQFPQQTTSPPSP